VVWMKNNLSEMIPCILCGRPIDGRMTRPGFPNAYCPDHNIVISRWEAPTPSQARAAGQRRASTLMNASERLAQGVQAWQHSLTWQKNNEYRETLPKLHEAIILAQKEYLKAFD
jgi:hypothetical protein